MKTLINAATILAVALFAQNAIALIDCGPASIVAIQAERNSVLVKLKGANWEVWKSLGTRNDPALDSYQALAQQAMATDQSVFLRFADGYDCTATDYSTHPYMIRLVK